MSSDHSNDSTATKQKKADWRSAKFAEMIWRENGVDITMDESLINSWVNPHKRLQDDDYKPNLTYVEPPIDGYWDIPISPNAKYFTVFKPIDRSIPDDKRLPLEFERLNRFHAKHGSSIEKIWSNDRPSAFKNYKPQKFMKAEFIQYTFTRRRSDYV